MENNDSGKSVERVSLEGELQKWFAGQGVSSTGPTRAVQLLDASVLLAQPRPSQWNQRGDFRVHERCRYLWYKHATRILGWFDRRRFPDIVTTILCRYAFLEQGGRDEATRDLSICASECLISTGSRLPVTEACCAALHGQKSGWQAHVMGHETHVTPILTTGSPFVHAPTDLANEVMEVQHDAW